MGNGYFGHLPVDIFLGHCVATLVETGRDPIIHVVTSLDFVFTKFGSSNTCKEPRRPFYAVSSLLCSCHIDHRLSLVSEFKSNNG